MTDFIMDNTVWVIIFGVLIVMALIGYMAENSKKTKEKKGEKQEVSKEKPKEESREIPVEVSEKPEAPSIANEIENSVPTFETVSPSETTAVESTSVSADSSVSFEMPAESNTTGEANVEMPSTVTSMGEDLTVPLETATPVASAPQSQPVSESASIESILAEANIAMEPSPQAQAPSASSSLGVDDVSQLFGETKKEEPVAPEDVWKF